MAEFQEHICACSCKVARSCSVQVMTCMLSRWGRARSCCASMSRAILHEKSHRIAQWPTSQALIADLKLFTRFNCSPPMMHAAHYYSIVDDTIRLKAVESLCGSIGQHITFVDFIYRSANWFKRHLWILRQAAFALGFQIRMHDLQPWTQTRKCLNKLERCSIGARQYCHWRCIDSLD